MEYKEIILSKIAEVYSRNEMFIKDNSEFKSRLRCVGLGSYFDKYQDYLIPYYFNDGYSYKFKNQNEEYSVFLGLDCIFADLYHLNKHGEIVALLKELTKSINIAYIIYHNGEDDFEELANLYNLLGLDLAIEEDKVKVFTFMGSDTERINELFSVELWLKHTYSDVYDAYQSAIDTYTQGHAGACIESCRTCLVSIFSKFQGTEKFSKWMRGIYNTTGDSEDATVQDLSQALSTDLRKDDLADFFYENRSGKLTKTKTIYMIYSMMSDYGTHRNESTQEVPSIEDALFSLRLTDSILFWIYSRRR